MTGATGRRVRPAYSGLPVFTLAAVLVGATTGLVAASYRVLLDHVARLRDDLVGFAHDHAGGLLVVVAVATLLTAASAWLVHRVEPHAEGSGIPRIEAVVEGRTTPARFRVLPVKYVGGLLAIGGGLALGREGPSVQMGGAIGNSWGRALRCSTVDLRILIAGGAAAGLATAFNAPLAGGVFILEELLKRFDPRTTLATLLASGSGFAAAHVLIGDHADYRFPHLGPPHLAEAPVVAVVGVVCGVLGVAYNRVLVGSVRFMDRSTVPPVLRAALIGAVVGGLAFLAPHLVGSGENLTQDALLGRGTVLAVLGVFALRFCLGVVSYAAFTPGGLFAPMLVLGADLGLVVGLIAQQLLPAAAAPAPQGLALIGVAAFFTSVVQAPVTGLVLATELTGSAVLLAPMLGACALAMIVATVLRTEPIYDALARRSAAMVRENEVEEAARTRTSDGP